ADPGSQNQHLRNPVGPRRKEQHRRPAGLAELVEPSLNGRCVVRSAVRHRPVLRFDIRPARKRPGELFARSELWTLRCAEECDREDEQGDTGFAHKSETWVFLNARAFLYATRRLTRHAQIPL